jgi:GDP-mannose 4,6-dehydratase
MSSKVALVTGVTGQDGSYLADLLIEKGYEVHGMVRRTSTINTGRIAHLMQESLPPEKKINLHYGDLSDSVSLRGLLDLINPDEVYNLGAQSHVRISFDQPEYTADVTGLGVLRLLESIREYIKYTKRQVRFYQAGSSEMFGSAQPPQNELTRFQPRSPYAVAKVAGYYFTINHRESYGMFAANGILFNHESPRRGENFVTRKITRNLARIKVGLIDSFKLGNLDAKRDWGHAKDYVEAMWLMLQQDKPDDYVIATGETHSVREFLDQAAAALDLDPDKCVTIDKNLFRPAEVDVLLGDPSKAKEKLGWEPRISFNELVSLMVEEDLLFAEMEKRHSNRLVVDTID